MKTKSAKRARCERCYKLYAPADLCEDGADVVCVDCIDKAPAQSEQTHAAPAAVVAPPAPAVTRPEVERARCEKCFRLVAAVALHQIGADVLCESCCVGQKRWFAIALVGAEGKITKNIRDRAKK